jgi:hypothetical protein
MQIKYPFFSLETLVQFYSIFLDDDDLPSIKQSFLQPQEVKNHSDISLEGFRLHEKI